MSFQSQLHLGAGSIEFEEYLDGNFYVFVDQCYDSDKTVNEVSSMYRAWVSLGDSRPNVFNNLVAMDIFDFADSYPYKFDKIIAKRIFEHMFFDSGEIGRLLSACYKMLSRNGIVEIIVPNAMSLLQTLKMLDDDGCDPAIFSKVILETNTELCNTRSDPHGSVWTPTLARHYIDQEGVWRINNIEDVVFHEDRDCYMRIILSKKNYS